MRCGLAFFFLSVLPRSAFAAAETDFFTYIVRVSIGLLLFALAGWLLVRFYGPKTGVPRESGVEVRAVVPLGRDLLRVIRCGPEVVVLLTSKGETQVIGRWAREEWEKACALSRSE